MFELNGKKYQDIELTFNDICELEANGVDLTNLNQKNMLSALRAIIALRFNGNVALAGNEIEEHIKKGGTFDDLVKIVSTAVEKSGFFQALNNQQAQ